MARASAFQAEGRGFESRFPLQIFNNIRATSLRDCAHVAQLVEHILGKDEVTSSILVVGSSKGELCAIILFWLARNASKEITLRQKINAPRKTAWK